jgi:hypothetical protein
MAVRLSAPRTGRTLLLRNRISYCSRHSFFIIDSLSPINHTASNCSLLTLSASGLGVAFFGEGQVVCCGHRPPWSRPFAPGHHRLVAVSTSRSLQASAACLTLDTLLQNVNRLSDNKALYPRTQNVSLSCVFRKFPTMHSCVAFTLILQSSVNYINISLAFKRNCV